MLKPWIFLISHILFKPLKAYSKACFLFKLWDDSNSNHAYFISFKTEKSGRWSIIQQSQTLANLIHSSIFTLKYTYTDLATLQSVFPWQWTQFLCIWSLIVAAEWGITSERPFLKKQNKACPENDHKRNYNSVMKVITRSGPNRKLLLWTSAHPVFLHLERKAAEQKSLTSFKGVSQRSGKGCVQEGAGKCTVQSESFISVRLLRFFVHIWSFSF